MTQTAAADPSVAPQPAATAAQLAAPPTVENVAPVISAPEIAPVRVAPQPALAKPPIASPESYTPPNSLVFSERSTGCKMVVKTGRGVTNLCGTPAGIEARRSPTSQPSLAQRAGSLSITTALPGRASQVTFSSNAARPSVSVSRRGYTPTALLQKYYNRTYRPPGRLSHDNVRLMFPLSIPAPITSLFGWRIHPITGDSRFHAGTDLGAPLGTPVLAALAGRVAIADWLGGYGMVVALQHGEQGQQQTLYAHLSEIFVKPGEPVQQGEVIGRVGSTGLSTGPHLHFEFRQQTPDGWVALDAGEQLEYGLAQLIQSMQPTTAKAKPQKEQS